MSDLTASVEGVTALVNSLDGAAAELARLDHTPGATALAAAAEARTPRRTGALAATVRASVVDDGLIVEAGGGSVDYAGVVHAHTPFIADAIAAQTDTVVDAYATQLETIIDTVKGA